jgi:23S rRNA (adenine2503-C2)-methyltransferase
MEAPKTHRFKIERQRVRQGLSLCAKKVKRPLIMITFQSLTKAELELLLIPVISVKRKTGMSDEEIELKRRKKARYHARQLFHWVYQRFVDDWEEMTDLSKELRAWLTENVKIHRLTEKTSHQSLDGTQKFLWSLHDAKTVESVIIPSALQEKGKNAFEPESKKRDSVEVELSENRHFSGRPLEEDEEDEDGPQWARLTACISSQVGCAMKCKFCLTGIQGLDRHLEVHEVVTQIHELRRLAPITNIVFMGMGEPLHNVDNIIKACQIFLDQDGFNFSKRKVTVSTSGLVPAIKKLGESVDVSLAISLNATTDEIRSEIMPVNKRWNLDALLTACRNYPLGKHRRITFEYVLLKGVTDSMDDAKRIEKLLHGIPSKVNLIPFNEHSGADYKRPDDARVKEFQRYLLSRNITTTVRISRGRDISAACGQLRSLFGTARGTDKHRDYASPAQAESSNQ